MTSSALKNQRVAKRWHRSSDGLKMDGTPRRACGCQSCRHRFGPPLEEAPVVSALIDMRAAELADDDDIATHCETCGDPFTETGPGAQSLASPGNCVYCYTEGYSDA